MKITVKGMYGEVRMPSPIFDNLDHKFFISECTNNIVYMCANENELNYLISIGVEISDYYFDWIKIYRDDNL